MPPITPPAKIAAHQARRLTERHLLDLLLKISPGAMLVDERDRIVVLNQAAATALGRTASELEGQPLSDHLTMVNAFDGERGDYWSEPGSPLPDQGDMVVTVQLHSSGATVHGVDRIPLDLPQRAGYALYLLPHSPSAEHAVVDLLTGTLARPAFEHQATELIRGTRVGQSHVLILVDLNLFKLINDRYGHDTGDAVLRHLATVLRSYIGDMGLIGRTGGDEFSVLIPNASQETGVTIAKTLMSELCEKPLTADGRPVPISAAFGVTVIRTPGTPYSSAAREVRVASEIAKSQRRPDVRLYDPSECSASTYESHVEWAARVADALATDRFCMYGQFTRPTSGRDSEWTYIEALIRMTSEEDGSIISPALFLDAAERYNLMPRVDVWVVRHVVGLIREMLASGKDLDRFTIGINLSGLSLSDDSAMEEICNLVDANRDVAKFLCFEITERTAIRAMEPVQQFITNLRDAGCRFALDDFGAGLASYQYLTSLRFDILKIDGCFMGNLSGSVVNRAIVRSIAEVASAMSLETIAEYVEDQATLETLRTLGVDQAQGYLFSVPAPLEGTIINLLEPPAAHPAARG